MTLNARVLKEFTKRKQTLALAESCTGGLASSLITEVPGASEYFLGSVVCYANAAKHDLLGVSETILKTKGAVSKQAAVQMAKGARRIFKSNWSVAITGIAGPGGGTPIKPVGLVFFAVAGPKNVVTQKKVFKGNRKKIQKVAAEWALGLLLRKLKQT